MSRRAYNRLWFWSAGMTCATALIACIPLSTAPAEVNKPADAVGGHVVEAHPKNGKYHPQPTRLLKDFPTIKANLLPDLTEFGGVKRYPASKATGFFRTEKIDGRWWLIDPTGHRMIDVGVASTIIGKLSPAGQAAFDHEFGSPEKWAERTRDLLRVNGFDGTGNWSDDDRLRDGAKTPLIYTRSWSFMGSYGQKRGGTFAEPGHQGYPEKCIFAFDPQFAEFADAFAQDVAKDKDNPYLIGYFTDNELPFPLDALDRYLNLPDVDPGRKAADAFVTGRHVNRDAITGEDRQAFMVVLAERYFSVVHDALRKYDPNHLILGPRFWGSDHRNPALLATAAKYIDVCGYNLYNVWTPGRELMSRLSVCGKMPVLITEFYTKGDDVGMGNTDGAGWTVRTQADRGAFYQNFTLALLESHESVGWHWFKYIDGDPAMPKGVSRNDSNKGIVNNRFVPYPALLDAMRALNVARYDVIDYFDRAARAGRRSEER